MTRPGHRVRTIASRLFAARTLERVVDPILADLQCEYDEAIGRGLRWRARLGLVRNYFGFGSALFWLGVRTLWHTDHLRSDAARTCAVAATASAFATVLLVIPPLLDWRWWREDPGFTALLCVTLVPQALPLSLPVGLCVAVLWAMRGKRVTSRRIGTVLAIAFACTIAVWVVLEWMMPQANQSFRGMLAARLSDGRVLALEPGLNELGLSRLGRRTDPAAVHHYQLLWALCFASAPLSLLAFGLARYVRRAASAVVLGAVVANSYLAILWTCEAIASGRTMPPFVPVWTPNVLFVLAGCALLVRAAPTGHHSRWTGGSGRA